MLGRYAWGTLLHQEYVGYYLCPFKRAGRKANCTKEISLLRYALSHSRVLAVEKIVSNDDSKYCSWLQLIKAFGQEKFMEI